MSAHAKQMGLDLRPLGMNREGPSHSAQMTLLHPARTDSSTPVTASHATVPVCLIRLGSSRHLYGSTSHLRTWLAVHNF